MVRAAVALLLATSVGCPRDPEGFPDDDDTEPTPRAGELDRSGLRDGRVSLPYAGRLLVREYDGPVEFTSGALPDGLQMTPGGSFYGTPTRYGEFDFVVVAEGMEGIQDFTERVPLRILPAEATDVFIGIAHPHLNNLWTEQGLFRDPWMRVTGGGEGESQTFVLEPGIYGGGPDGEATGGLGDDVLIARLDIAEVGVVVGEFAYTPAEDPRLPSYPSGHYNEWDPPAYDPATGTLTAGADSGVLPVEITHPQYGSLLLRVVVAGPDWCASGVETLCE